MSLWLQIAIIVALGMIGILLVEIRRAVEALLIHAEAIEEELRQAMTNFLIREFRRTSTFQSQIPISMRCCRRWHPYLHLTMPCWSGKFQVPGEGCPKSLA
jgi:hypothetical protein